MSKAQEGGRVGGAWGWVGGVAQMAVGSLGRRPPPATTEKNMADMAKEEETVVVAGERQKSEVIGDVRGEEQIVSVNIDTHV